MAVLKDHWVSARECNDYYKAECNERGGSSNDIVAEKMLREDKYDRSIALGLDGNAYDLEALYKGFF
ncbi:hypothetical protein H4R27_006388, partial [Coemansia aciculifera]